MKHLLTNPLLYVGVAVIALWGVALRTTEPRYTPPQRPHLVWSFSPNCPEAPEEEVAAADIAGLAESLGLRGIYQGMSYVNEFGVCYTPGQVVRLAQNREKYQQEIEEHWRKSGQNP